GGPEVDRHRDRDDQHARLAPAHQHGAAGAQQRQETPVALGRRLLLPRQGPGHACAIGPERSTSFTAVDEPSDPGCVVWYVATLSLVTNNRPVLVCGGEMRPPEILKRYR